MDNKKKCYNCTWFQRYYTKGTKKFSQTKLGRCCIKNDTVEACATCDKFKIKHVGNAVAWSAKHTLNNILTDISAIRQIIEERVEEYEELQ